MRLGLAPISTVLTLIGPLFNEPMRVETVSAAGNSSLVVGLVGAQSERFRRVTMSESDLAILEAISLAGNAEDVRAEIVELKQLAMQAKAAETRSRNGDAARAETGTQLESITSYVPVSSPQRIACVCASQRKKAVTWPSASGQTAKCQWLDKTL